MDFLQRLSGSRALVLDGAIGTELEARGAPQRSDAAWADCNETHPGIVAAVHEDYVRTGGDFIACSTGLHILEQIGLGNPVSNRRNGALELASHIVWRVARAHQLDHLPTVLQRVRHTSHG